MSEVDEKEIERALQPMRQALAADGFDLKVKISDDVLLITVEAGAEACADCLIPKELMDEMIVSRIKSEGFALEGRAVQVLYPLET